MTATVSTASIFTMAFSALLALALPIVLLIVWRKRTHAKFSAAICGALTFVIFVYILENALHGVCIMNDTPISRVILNNSALYVLYAGFAAGIFEETGRYIAFRWILKKQRGRETGVMYGIGHGGIEAILICTLSMISNMALALTINAGGLDAMLATVPAEQLASLNSVISSLIATPSSMYLVSGIERITAIALHISLSVMVFFAARKPGKFYLYPLAILFHAAVDCFAVLYHVGVIKGICTIEAGVALMTVAVTFYAVKLYKANAPAPEESDAAEISEATEETAEPEAIEGGNSDNAE